MDEHHFPGAAFLPVIDAADQRQDSMEDGLVAHVMLAVEADGFRIMGGEQVKGMDQGIVDTEQAVDPILFLRPSSGGRIPGIDFGNAFKAAGRDFPEVFQQSFRHQDGGGSVLTGIVVFLAAQAVVFQQGIRELEGRIDQETYEDWKFKYPAFAGFDEDGVAVIYDENQSIVPLDIPELDLSEEEREAMRKEYEESVEEDE